MHGDPRVGPQRPGQLAVPDVGRHHVRGARPQQHVGEPAGGRPRVQARSGPRPSASGRRRPARRPACGRRATRSRAPPGSATVIGASLATWVAGLAARWPATATSPAATSSPACSRERARPRLTSSASSLARGAANAIPGLPGSRPAPPGCPAAARAPLQARRRAPRPGGRTGGSARPRPRPPLRRRWRAEPPGRPPPARHRGPCSCHGPFRRMILIFICRTLAMGSSSFMCATLRLERYRPMLTRARRAMASAEECREALTPSPADWAR